MDESDIISGLDSSFESDEALFIRCGTKLLGLTSDSTHHFLAM